MEDPGLARGVLAYAEELRRQTEGFWGRRRTGRVIFGGFALLAALLLADAVAVDNKGGALGYGLMLSHGWAPPSCGRGGESARCAESTPRRGQRERSSTRRRREANDSEVRAAFDSAVADVHWAIRFAGLA